MKRILYLILFVFFSFGTTYAQVPDITGKWEIPTSFLKNLGFQYGNISGYCKFKNRGTMQIVIKGRKRLAKYHVANSGTRSPHNVIHSKQRQMHVKIKGSYKIENGCITTFIDTQDIDCYIDPGQDYPDYPDGDAGEMALRMYEYKQRVYDQAAFNANVQSRTVKDRMLTLWSFRNDSIIVTDNTFAIGDRVILIKK